MATVKEIVRAKSGHLCVTLLDLPQLVARLYEVGDGHSCFDDEEPQPGQKPKERCALMTVKGRTGIVNSNDEFEVSEVKKKFAVSVPTTGRMMWTVRQTTF